MTAILILIAFFCFIGCGLTYGLTVAFKYMDEGEE